MYANTTVLSGFINLMEYKFDGQTSRRNDLRTGMCHLYEVLRGLGVSFVVIASLGVSQCKHQAEILFIFESVYLMGLDTGCSTTFQLVSR
jgi:hypothetical protein